MTTPDGAPAKKLGPPLALAIVLIILGTAMGIGGLAKGVSKVIHDVHGTQATSPADISRHLDSGTWQVYVADSFSGFRTLSPSDVTVTAPGGEQVSTRSTSDNVTERLTTGGRSYLGEVQFTIDQPGEYDVRVGGPPGEQILLSKSFGDVAKHAAKWFVLMGAGFLVGLIGVVLLIVGIVRRSRAKRPPVNYPTGPYGGTPQPPATPPPGWYPDASVPGMSRWWDGTRWTDQTHTP